ncbi:Glutaredoxin [Maioricimonas rarisocia]|uniref:Glutaredoxin n=1 Tax=Maioricimonas rarisocia TaxID=2528026 RepID=A0A517Z8H3_9PLAN|nr:glutaredoxin domain-containing protein [Maioricimonas rarisocia]QDU38765.1 Glutaredoxin [Maioricimonas rarisocia]
MKQSIHASSLLVLAVAVLFAAPTRSAWAASRCINLEMYYRSSDEQSSQTVARIAELIEARDGVRVRPFDLDSDESEAAQARLDRLVKYYKLREPQLPIVYGCRQVLSEFDGPSSVESRLTSLLRMDVYTRAGCPRCARARAYLKSYSEKYPGLEVRIFDIVSDSRARNELQKLAREHRTAAASVPVFHFCNKLMVGFDSSGLMSRRLEKELNHWTSECPGTSTSYVVPERSRLLLRGRLPVVTTRSVRASAMLPITLAFQQSESPGALESSSDAPSTSATEGEESGLPPPLPLPPEAPADDAGNGDDMLPLPGDDETLPLPGDDLPLPGGESAGQSEQEPQIVELPVWGKLNLDAIGLPLFTIAIGLVDGFNPCAMWVLLFLLSILVNLKQRWKILAVAGTFVLISGLAYFAFMAAWLNVFLFVGLLRWVQVLLGTIAVIVGSIHIKDFFAFKQGVSLSIPESAKPGIYARVRRIVTAENLFGAIVGASILAVLVNIVELLCTAGLPALYTQILAMQDLPTWNNYLYLGLYNLAYMADDALMVTIVVVTLGRHKMQETQGRWLKLISGCVIFILGLVMIVRPDWLV